jgi:hypothetical protein
VESKCAVAAKAACNAANEIGTAGFHDKPALCSSVVVVKTHSFRASLLMLFLGESLFFPPTFWKFNNNNNQIKI